MNTYSENRLNHISNWVLLLLLFLFPILPQYVYVIGGVNIVNFSVLLLLILYFCLKKSIIIKRVFLEIPFYWIYMIFLCSLYFVQDSFVKGLSFTLSFIILPNIIISEVNNRNRFMNAIDILICGGAVLAVLGIIEEILGFNFIQLFSNGKIAFLHEIRYGILRVMATFGQPIPYGLFQVFIIGLINYRLSTAVRRKRKYYIIYILSLLNIICTVSRAAMIAFVLVQFWFLYKKSTEKKFVTNLFWIISALLISAVFCEAFGIKLPLIDDMLNTIAGTMGSSENDLHYIGLGNRLDLWYWIYESLKGSFVLGKGISVAFSYAVDLYFIKTSIENQYLNILYRTGIVGLALMVCSYVSILMYSAKNSKSQGRIFQEKEISFNKSMFIMLSVYYLIELTVQETDLTRFYVVLIALLISYNKIGKKREEST